MSEGDKLKEGARPRFTFDLQVDAARILKSFFFVSDTHRGVQAFTLVSKRIG